MSIEQYKQIAIKYLVEDIQSATLPSTTLSNILKTLEANGKSVSVMALNFLRRKEFSALLAYSKRECSFEDYLNLAKQENSSRQLIIEKEAQQQAKLQIERELAAEVRRKAAYERQLAYDNDPKNIAKAKQLKLRNKYDLSHFIERNYFPKLMRILQTIDKGIRLSENEVVWLNIDGKEYFTKEMRISFHYIEACFYATEFKKKKDPWFAVNASSHYRKCGKSNTADLMLSALNVSDLKNIKLRSAIYTTHGGVKRDLSRSQEALSLGEMAHKLTKKDFRPCTLLGAVNIEKGSYDIGQAWYAKAITNGFCEKAMDSELKSIYMRATKPDKESLRNHLFKLDPKRYKWAK